MKRMGMVKDDDRARDEERDKDKNKKLRDNVGHEQGQGQVQTKDIKKDGSLEKGITKRIRVKENDKDRSSR